MLYTLVFGMMAGGCIDVVHFGVWNDGRRQRVRRNSTVVEKIYLSQYAQQSPLSRSGSKRG